VVDGSQVATVIPIEEGIPTDNEEQEAAMVSVVAAS